MQAAVNIQNIIKKEPLVLSGRVYQLNTSSNEIYQLELTSCFKRTGLPIEYVFQRNLSTGTVIYGWYSSQEISEG